MNPAMETKVEEADKMVKAIGELGRWQLMLWLLIATPVKISSVWQMLGIIFIAPATTFMCSETKLTNSTQMDTCYSDCVSYNFFSDFENTIISQWELICDRAWLANFTQTMCMFGVLIGSMVFGYVADR